jgi:hypothetical protein
MGKNMRRWILLGILVITATRGGWTLIQRHRQAVERERETAWLMTYQRPIQGGWRTVWAVNSTKGTV